MNALLGKVFLPGDVLIEVGKETFSIGPGLRLTESVIATRPGILCCEPSLNYYYLASKQKRYVPMVDDMVIGIIVERLGENYRVDIGSAAYATLPILGFDGATKKTRPQLNKGDLVYARVVVANKDMDPELICLSKRNKSDGFGDIKIGGYMFKCSLDLCANLLKEDCYVLNRLGKEFPYEVAVGHNGRVHVNAVTPERTIVVTQAILNSAFLTSSQCDEMITLLLAKLKSSES